LDRKKDKLQVAVLCADEYESWLSSSMELAVTIQNVEDATKLLNQAHQFLTRCPKVEPQTGGA
jgi:hypothetical protein